MSFSPRTRPGITKPPGLPGECRWLWTAQCPFSVAYAGLTAPLTGLGGVTASILAGTATPYVTAAGSTSSYRTARMRRWSAYDVFCEWHSERTTMGGYDTTG
ncbi:hypothetical protein [Streptomyces sp. NPDC047028]|uniref:hypothetical protein n=1 Tax=Streptomyces sp. NPDC047028 TaxID=3155793 RepID=UPI0033C6907C